MELEMKFRQIAIFENDRVIIPAIILKKEPKDTEGMAILLPADIAENLAILMHQKVPGCAKFFQLVGGIMAKDLGYRITKAVVDRAIDLEKDQVEYSATFVAEKNGKTYAYSGHDSTEVIALAIVSGLPLFVTEEIFEKYKQAIPCPDACDDFTNDEFSDDTPDKKPRWVQ